MAAKGAYYNEHDPFAAAWLRELIKAGLIADGDVDERSIEDVSADDVRGYTQAHWFAGIGGWAYALRLAGWPDDRPVWSGSCPCQRHSSAARGRNVAAECWPWFFGLIQAHRPRVVFGEQVSAARAWMDGVCDDFARVDYAVKAAILPAYSAGFDHARERIYFAGHTNSHGESGCPVDAETSWMSWPGRYTRGVVSPHGVSRDVVALSGFGNAIVPQVAQIFIAAYIDTVTESEE